MRRRAALLLLVGVIAAAALLWVAYSGRAFLKADVEFHMYPAQFPRLTQWHVRGSFEVPTATLTSP